MNMANGGGSPTFDDLPRMTEVFPRASLEAWQAAAQRTLGPRPLASLTVASHEGIPIKPVYTAARPPARHREDQVAPRWVLGNLFDRRSPGTGDRGRRSRHCGQRRRLGPVVDRRSQEQLVDPADRGDDHPHTRSGTGRIDLSRRANRHPCPGSGVWRRRLGDSAIRPRTFAAGSISTPSEPSPPTAACRGISRRVSG